MKKGFTLVELLVVIALIGFISIIIVPKVISIFNDSLDKDIKIEENNIKDAAKLYIQDYCINSEEECPETFKVAYYICLSDLQKKNSDGNKYLDVVKYKDDVCKGAIVFDKEKNYTSAKTYLKCGNEYVTNESFVNLYSGCF